METLKHTYVFLMLAEKHGMRPTRLPISIPTLISSAVLSKLLSLCHPVLPSICKKILSTSQVWEQRARYMDGHQMVIINTAFLIYC